MGISIKEGGREPESGAVNAAAKSVARMQGGGDRCGSLSWTAGGLKEKPARPGPEPALWVQALRVCLRWAMSPIIRRLNDGLRGLLPGHLKTCGDLSFYESAAFDPKLPVSSGRNRPKIDIRFRGGEHQIGDFLTLKNNGDFTAIAKVRIERIEA